MNTSPFERQLTPHERAALMDAAKQRALEARCEAVDAFWTGAGQHLASAWHALVHAAQGPATAVNTKEPACRP